MLDSFVPGTPIHGAISPAHLSEPISLILYVSAPIRVPGLPLEVAPPVFLIIQIVALVLICLCIRRETRVECFPPLAMAVFETILEGTLVGVAIRPLVLTVTLRLTIQVLANVHIIIGEEVCAISMSEACLPLALVPVPIQPHVHAVALSLAGLPLSDV